MQLLEGASAGKHFARGAQGLTLNPTLTTSLVRPQVACVEFGASVDGAPLLASCGGNACMVWDFSGEGPAGSAPTMCLGHTKALDCCAWHPAAPGLLATGGRDGRLILFELHNAAEVRALCHLATFASRRQRSACAAYCAAAPGLCLHSNQLAGRRLCKPLCNPNLRVQTNATPNPQGMEEGMPSLCGPAAVDPEPKEEVVAVAWAAGGALVSAHANGEVRSWRAEL